MPTRDITHNESIILIKARQSTILKAIKLVSKIQDEESKEEYIKLIKDANNCSNNIDELDQNIESYNLSAIDILELKTSIKKERRASQLDIDILNAKLARTSLAAASIFSVGIAIFGVTIFLTVAVNTLFTLSIILLGTPALTASIPLALDLYSKVCSNWVPSDRSLTKYQSKGLAFENLENMLPQNTESNTHSKTFFI